MWNFCNNHPYVTVVCVLIIGICAIDISANIVRGFIWWKQLGKTVPKSKEESK